MNDASRHPHVWVVCDVIDVAEAGIYAGLARAGLDLRVYHGPTASPERLETLRAAGIRSEADYADKNMKEKIKYFHQYKDPYIVVVGDREAEERTVSVNIRGNKKMNGVPLDRFIEICQKMNREHSLELTESAD